MKNPFRKKKKENRQITTAPDGRVIVKEAGVPERPGRSKKQGEPVEDAYYVKLATGTRIVRYVVTVLLLIFAIGMAFFYRSSITAENFGLLFRNASFSFPGEKKAFETVRYDADLQMDFAMYKDYFAAATTTCMRLYDHRGNVVLDENVRMKNPAFSDGKTYLMVYDIEGKNYFICNSVAVLKEEECERTIYDADMSDQGSYLVVSSSAQRLSTISVYNKSFNLRTTLSFDRYPQKALLSEDGEKLIFLSYGTDRAGALEGCVSFFDLSEQKAKKLIDNIYDEIPLSCVMTEKGAAVLFERRVIFYDGDGNERFRYDFTGGTPAGSRLSADYVALRFEGNPVLAENTIVILDCATGKETRTLTHTGRIKNMWLEQDTLFLGEDTALSCVNVRTGAERRLARDLPADVVFCGETLFVCYTSKAENIYASLKNDNFFTAAYDGAELPRAQATRKEQRQL